MPLLEISSRNYEPLLFPYARILPEKRGLLQAIHDNGQYIGIEVNFTHLLWMHQDWIASGIIDYFKQQGFAMAVKLPYLYDSGILTVTECSALYSRCAGFESAIPKERDPIPF